MSKIWTRRTFVHCAPPTTAHGRRSPPPPAAHRQRQSPTRSYSAMSFSNKKDASNLTRGDNQDTIAAMMKEAEAAAAEGAVPACRR